MRGPSTSIPVGMPASRDDGWRSQLSEILNGAARINLIGVGNPIKQDDSVGLKVLSELRRLLGPAPTPKLTIHEPSMSPERTLSRLASAGEKIVVIDAVEANREAGSIVCARLNETKFGFFATHNIPLRLVPGLGDASADAYIVGIQPESVDVGEGLSASVRASSKRLVAAIVGIAEGA
jgi:hydrogenase maturation protease